MIPKDNRICIIINREKKEVIKADTETAAELYEAVSIRTMSDGLQYSGKNPIYLMFLSGIYNWPYDSDTIDYNDFSFDAIYTSDTASHGAYTVGSDSIALYSKSPYQNYAIEIKLLDGTYERIMNILNK